MKRTAIFLVVVLVISIFALSSCDIIAKIPVIGDLINKPCTEHVDADKDYVCDNCGENFEKDIEFDLSEKFIEQYDSHNEEDYLIKQACVEIDKPVIDNLLLNIPTKMLCKDDCKSRR